MIPTDRPNPFLVLQLPTDAGDEDVVGRGQELGDTALDEDQRALCRWAVEQLITHPATRLAWELFEVPGAVYRDAAWEQFVRTHKRSLVDRDAPAEEAEPLRLEDFDLAALARLLADGLLAPPAVDLGAIVRGVPVEFALGPPPVEVKDVIFG